MSPTEFETYQEFLVDCPGCQGTGKGHGFGGRCIQCNGERQRTLMLKIPKPGGKVRPKIGQETMLESMFGRDEKGNLKVTHTTVGVVHDLQMPEEHHMELGPTSLGVRVNFDGDLTVTGRIKKNRKEATLWIFDLYELVVI